MTWLEFKCRVKDVTSRLTSDEVPITFLYGDREIIPDDITVCCGATGDKIELIIDLKEGGAGCK